MSTETSIKIIALHSFHFQSIWAIKLLNISTIFFWKRREENKEKGTSHCKCEMSDDDDDDYYVTVYSSII